MANKTKAQEKEVMEVTSKEEKGKQNAKRYNQRRRAVAEHKPNRQERRAMNDIGWYSRYPAIYDAAANLVWSRPTGIASPRNYKGLDASLNLEQRSDFLSLPGILCLEMVHGIGNTDITGTNAPVNVAAKAIYTWTRHMNSGHANYDGPDLMLYLLAMNEAYAAISFIGRAFGTIAMFSGGNRLLPEALLSMGNVDGTSIRDNYANFRARMNILIQKAASLVVPMGLDIFNRTAFLYANYYTEGDSVKDQIYFMKPGGFRVFERDSSGAGKLTWYDLSHWYSGGSLTWGSLCQILEDILTPLIADEDINIMAGDLLKAYGESGIQKLVFLPEMFIATPQRVEEVLWQIKNAKIVSGTVTNLDIVQDGNHEYLMFEPETTATPNDIIANTIDVVLVTDKIPTKEINMINSRLAVTVDYGVIGAAPTAGTIHCGSDFARNAIYCYVGNNNVPVIQTFPRIIDYSTMSGPEFASMCILSSFKFAPETVMSTSGAYVGLNRYDLDDYTIVDPGTLSTIHDAAVLSLFATPHVGM